VSVTTTVIEHVAAVARGVRNRPHDRCGPYRERRACEREGVRSRDVVVADRRFRAVVCKGRIKCARQHRFRTLVGVVDKLCRIRRRTRDRRQLRVVYLSSLLEHVTVLPLKRQSPSRTLSFQTYREFCAPEACRVVVVVAYRRPRTVVREERRVEFRAHHCRTSTRPYCSTEPGSRCSCSR
jgi:hypothetical protein